MADSISLLNKTDCRNQTATPFCEFSEPMEMSPEEILNFGSEIDQCNFTSDENEGKAFKKRYNFLEIYPEFYNN